MEKLHVSWNESSRQPTDSEDLVILACTVFDWSTRVTDRIAMAKTRYKTVTKRSHKVQKIKYKTAIITMIEIGEY